MFEKALSQLQAAISSSNIGSEPQLGLAATNCWVTVANIGVRGGLINTDLLFLAQRVVTDVGCITDIGQLQEAAVARMTILATPRSIERISYLVYPNHIKPDEVRGEGFEVIVNPEILVRYPHLGDPKTGGQGIDQLPLGLATSGILSAGRLWKDWQAHISSQQATFMSINAKIGLSIPETLASSRIRTIVALS